MIEGKFTFHKSLVSHEHLFPLLGKKHFFVQSLKSIAILYSLRKFLSQQISCFVGKSARSVQFVCPTVLIPGYKMKSLWSSLFTEVHRRMYVGYMRILHHLF